MARDYSNGYIPKIQYWLGESKEAINKGNVERSQYALKKAEYFMGRHQKVYGNNVIAGVDFSQSLEELTGLGRS